MTDLLLALTISEDVSWPQRLESFVNDVAVIASTSCFDDAKACMDEEWVRVVIFDQRLDGAQAMATQIAKLWPDIITLRAVRLGEAKTDGDDARGLTQAKKGLTRVTLPLRLCLWPAMPCAQERQL